MYEWQSFFNKYKTSLNFTTDYNETLIWKSLNKYKVYPDSINYFEDSLLFIAEYENIKKLIVIGESSIYKDFEGEAGEAGSRKIKICLLNHANCVIIRREFPYSAPSAILHNDITIGLGDRLGLATPGHIRLIRQFNVKPVFAQQSIRELGLTGRTYDDVLDDVSWAVFQEGYKDGFGADGDHLKKPEEIAMALKCGFTMITLDCSEHIDNSVYKLDDAEIELLYSKYSIDEKTRWENQYALKKFFLEDNYFLEFSLSELKRIVLTYGNAIKYAIKIFNDHIKSNMKGVNFEISIDETLISTSLQAHFLFASELTAAGVNIATIAPRFCGEFQKGIDYIGNIDEFRENFSAHAKIAAFFGYKISVHSGSDKFSVFPIVGQETKGRYHVKTAGTNWLEAVRVIAEKDPALYREMHVFALQVLSEAKKYYHISADINNIEDIKNTVDALLPEFMNRADSRQVLHITYGLILLAKKPDGSPLFKDRIYSVLSRYSNEYYEALHKHIGKHLLELGNECTIRP